MGGQIEGKNIGRDGAAAGHDGGPIVHLLVEGRGELHGLDLGFEGSGEGPIDQTVEAVFESVEKAHRPILCHRRGCQRLPRRCGTKPPT